jgi:hypothetical protein
MVSVPVPFPRHAALAGKDVVLQFAKVELPADTKPASLADPLPDPVAEPSDGLSAFASLLAAGKQPAQAGLGPLVHGFAPAGDDTLPPADGESAQPAAYHGHADGIWRSRLADKEALRHKVAQAIERGFADAVVTRSLMRVRQLAGGSVFARSQMPVFLLDKPALPLASGLLPPRQGAAGRMETVLSGD